MALATQCPHCKTTFRVAQDQLKLRAGLVRCGSCKEIFNGIEHLLRPDSVAHAPTPANAKPVESHATPADKHVEPTKPVVTHPVETEASEDLASEGIPISLLAKQPVAKVEPELAGTQLDFAYPDPLPESTFTPEPEPHPELRHQHHEERAEPSFEPRFGHRAEQHAEPRIEPHVEPHIAEHVEPAIGHEQETPAHADAVPASSTDDDAVQDLEAHAAEAVEFVDFVNVPRKHKETAPVILDVEENKPVDPLQRMTLVDLSDEDEPVDPYIEDVEDISEKAQEQATPHSEAEQEPEQKAEPTQPVEEEPDPLDQAIDELKRKPLRGKKKPKPYKRLPTQEVATEPSADSISDPEPDIDPEENDEPEFVKQSRRAQTVGRTVRIAMSIGSFVLLLGALGQATYSFRDQIAARMPETKPFLVDACLLLNCKVGLPMQIETISIESDQLETLNTNKDLSELTMLLHNSGTIVQAWPNLEVTLNDANNVALSRRVFAPHEYLPASVDSKKGFAANSEQPVKMRFDFTGIKPAGYHVGVFYP